MNGSLMIHSIYESLFIVITTLNILIDQYIFAVCLCILWFQPHWNYKANYLIMPINVYGAAERSLYVDYISAVYALRDI